jgi:hypothetical protein
MIKIQCCTAMLASISITPAVICNKLVTLIGKIYLQYFML